MDKNLFNGNGYKMPNLKVESTLVPSKVKVKSKKGYGKTHLPKKVIK